MIIIERLFDNPAEVLSGKTLLSKLDIFLSEAIIIVVEVFELLLRRLGWGCTLTLLFLAFSTFFTSLHLIGVLFFFVTGLIIFLLSI